MQLITSQKKSNKLQTQIGTFQTLIKNINNSIGFTEVAKSTISNQSDLLNTLSSSVDKLINNTNQDSLKKEIGNLLYGMDYLAKNRESCAMAK